MLYSAESVYIMPSLTPFVNNMSLKHFQQTLTQAIAMSQGNASVHLATVERTVTLVCLTVLLIGYVTALRINTLCIPEHTSL